MLEIALAPAPIPFRKVDERWWAFLIATRDFWHEVDLPPCASQEGRFDEVMAQDVATKRRLPREIRQPRVCHEGLRAQ